MPEAANIAFLEQRIAEMEASLTNAQPQIQQLDLSGDKLGAEKLREQWRPTFEKYQGAGKALAEERESVGRLLKNGKFLESIEPDEVPDYSEDGIYNKMSKMASAHLGERVNLKAGLDGWDRSKLAFFTPERQEAMLQEKYGPENVKSLNIIGKQYLMAKQNGEWKPLNKPGIDIKDLAAAPPEIIKGVGAIGGAALGGMATAGTVGTIPGAAAGYAATGTIMDAVAAKAFGQPYEFGESVGRNSMEGMIGMAIDIPTAKLGGIATRMAKGPIESPFIKTIAKAENELLKRGERIEVSQLARGGPEMLKRRVAYGESNPLSAIGRDVNTAMDRIQSLKTNAPKLEKAEHLYNVTRRALDESAKNTIRMVGLYSDDAARLLERTHNKQMAELVPTFKRGGTFNHGTRISNAMVAAEEEAKKTTAELYNARFYDTPEVKAIAVDPLDFTSYVKSKYYSRASRNPAIDSKLAEIEARPQNAAMMEKLQKQLNAGGLPPEQTVMLSNEINRLKEISGPLSAKNMDDYIRDLREAHDSVLTGTPNKQQVAADASRAADEFRRKVYQDAKVLNKWDDAASAQKLKMDLHNQQLGGMLKNTYGRSDMTPSEIVAKSISDPRIADDTLSAIKAHTPEEFDSVLRDMQQAYLRSTGIESKTGEAASQLSYNRDMVESLFGYNRMGDKNEFAGKEMLKKLDALNQDLKKLGADPSKVTMDDVAGMQKLMSEKDFAQFKSSVTKRIAAETEAEDIAHDALMKIAMRGHREAIQSHEFPKAMWKSTPEKLGRVLAKMSPDDQKVLRGDYMEHFFAKYPPTGAHGEYGEMLWNGDKFLRDIAKNPVIEKNLRRVVGDDMATKLIEESKLIQLMRREVPKKNNMKVGGTVNEAGYKGYLGIAPVLQKISDKWMAAAYRANKLPLISQMNKMGKGVSAAEYAQTRDKLVKALTSTSEGIQALTMTGRHDPEWAAQLSDLIGIDEQGAQYREEKGAERGWK